MVQLYVNDKSLRVYIYIYRGEKCESRRLAARRVNDGRRVVVTTVDDIGRLV